MIWRLLVATAALLAIASAGEVLGNVGAVNETTPTAQWGNITVHYVTVGKANNNFEVRSIVAEIRACSGHLLTRTATAK